MAKSKIVLDNITVNGKVDSLHTNGCCELNSDELKDYPLDAQKDTKKIEPRYFDKILLDDYGLIQKHTEIEKLSESLNDVSIKSDGNAVALDEYNGQGPFQTISFKTNFDNILSAYIKGDYKYEGIIKKLDLIAIDQPFMLDFVIDYLKLGKSSRFITKHHMAKFITPGKTNHDISNKANYIYESNMIKLDNIRERLCEFAINNLFEKNRTLSAHQVLTDAQFFLTIAGIISTIVAIAQFNNSYGYLAVTISMIFFAVTNIVKITSIIGFFSAYMSKNNNIIKKVGEKCIIEEDYRHYPIYTILVPVYKESGNLFKLTRALMSLDYPKGKLDIKILMEEDDENSIAIINSLMLPSYFDLIVVPQSNPKTKPKALNFGLCFAKGEYVTIYDAEDIPDRDQLKKALALLSSEKNIKNKVCCLQAKLDYHNARTNLITKQFTIEYNSLFRVNLPGYANLNLPLPLGGTSNHFIMDNLIQVGAWDPFNVTEDADLGYRLSRNGYKTAILNSQTFEEACSSYKSWIKQRTRWIKGWLQTYIVHTRSPLKTISEMGLINFVFFNLLSLTLIVSSLVYPLLYISLAIIFNNSGFSFYKLDIALQYIILFSLTNLFISFLVSAIAGYFGLKEANNDDLLIHLLFLPMYWFLLTIAAYRAIYQLIVTPYYWDKTEHNQSMSDVESLREKLNNIQY